MECKLEKEMSVQIPNELFNQISESECESLEEMALAYSYCVMNSLLTKYGLYYPDCESKPVTTKDVIQWLGYKTYNKQSVIVKRNGYLERAKIIKHVKEIPLGLINNYEMSHDTSIGGLLTASSINSDQTVKQYLGMSKQTFRNYTVPLPLFLIDRNGYANGTLIEYINTHTMSYGSIEKIIKKNKANTRNIRTEIYVYGLLKMFSYGRKKFSISGTTLESFNLISQSTFSKYVLLLEKHKLIKVYRGKQSDSFDLTNTYQII